MSRSCPNCRGHIGFFRIVKPFFVGGAERVTCDQCGSKLSKKMSKYTSFRFSAFPLGLLIAKLPNWFGLNMGFFGEIVYLLSIALLLIAGIYFLFPLKIYRA